MGTSWSSIFCVIGVVRILDNWWPIHNTLAIGCTSVAIGLLLLVLGK